jgi:hypothetical protein
MVEAVVGPVIRRVVASGEVFTGEVVGVVEYDAESGCLSLRDPEFPAEPPVGIIWPFGTTWDDETSSVVLPDVDILLGCGQETRANVFAEVIVSPDPTPP